MLILPTAVTVYVLPEQALETGRYYVITEAGFGADLGAEKFMDIKCRMAGLKPDAVVLVATVRALKYNGGVPKDQLSEENLEALAKRYCESWKNILRIFRNMMYRVVVTLNSFVTDTDAETSVYPADSVKREAVNLLFPRYGKKVERAVSLLAEKGT